MQMLSLLDAMARIQVGLYHRVACFVGLLLAVVVALVAYLVL